MPSYSTLADAQAACLARGYECTGVYDQRCSGTLFSACLAPWIGGREGCMIAPPSALDGFLWLRLSGHVGNANGDVSVAELDRALC